jgi:pyruvate kinase
MDVARLNFSHGAKEEHATDIANIRNVSAELGREVGIMLDLRGPRIRTGEIAQGNIYLREGSEFVLTSEQLLGNEERVALTYPNLPQDVKKGDVILIDDGRLELKAKQATETDIVCEVVTGGMLSSDKGVNLPYVPLPLPALTKKDEEDIHFGIEYGVDWIAASFVRDASGIKLIQDIIAQECRGIENIKVMAKIEKRQALANIDEIMDIADGVMVARGDLGVEIPVEEVPIMQKKIIQKAMMKAKPVLTATQMLESMISNPKPTRAEVSDIANAIFDGTDAIMLSGETAIGNYPQQCVKIMANVAEEAESALDYTQLMEARRYWGRNTTDAIGFAACEIAKNLKANAIVTATESGNTARQISRYRPETMIIAVTPHSRVARQLMLSWGIFPLKVRRSSSIDDLLDLAVNAPLRANLITEGNLIVITAGVFVNIPGTTNMIKVHKL